MTNPRSAKETLSEGTKTYLDEIFVQEYYNRKKEFSSKEMEKGTLCEEDSLEFLSGIMGTFLKKNESTYSNTLFKGTPDILLNDSVIDIKTSWDLFSFQKAEVTSLYDWQLECYALLTGKEKKYLTYCLVNSPAHLIDDEKRKMSYFIRDISCETEEYKDRAKQIEINMIFDLAKFKESNPGYPMEILASEWSYDIPAKDRVKTFVLPMKNELEISLLESRIQASRNYLNEKLKQVK